MVSVQYRTDNPKFHCCGSGFGGSGSGNTELRIRVWIQFRIRVLTVYQDSKKFNKENVRLFIIFNGLLLVFDNIFFTMGTKMSR
jgi:hypothetical protein